MSDDSVAFNSQGKTAESPKTYALLEPLEVSSKSPKSQVMTEFDGNHSGAQSHKGFPTPPAPSSPVIASTPPSTQSTVASGAPPLPLHRKQQPELVPLSTEVDIYSNQSKTESAQNDKGPATVLTTTGDSPLPTITMRALVSSREAGALIGKRGETVAQIRDDAQVRVGVSKSEPGVLERVVTVGGPIQKVAQAFCLIAEAILNSEMAYQATNNPNAYGISPPGASTVSIKLLIPHQQMGSIIGRQGQRIKAIQEDCSVRMIAAKEILPQSTERVVEMIGTPVSIERAIVVIAECLAQEVDRARGNISYVPQQGLSSAQQAAAGIAAITSAHIMARTQPSLPHMPNGSGSVGYSTSPSLSGNEPSSINQNQDHTHATGSNGVSFNGKGSSVFSSSASTPTRPSPVFHAASNSSYQHAPLPSYSSPGRPEQTSSAQINNQHSPNAFSHGLTVSREPLSQDPTVLSGSSNLSQRQPLSSSYSQPGNLSNTTNMSNTAVHEFAVPGDMVGCLIGRGGVKIQQIRKESGATITIAKDSESDGSGERRFTLRGSSRAIERALWLLYQQLEAEMQSRQR